MLFASPVYSQVSGSIAGITYFHGRSGLATKARSTPTNPNTARQRTIRHAVARLMPIWGRLLTANQRAAWNIYASNVPWKNPLGQTTFLTGAQYFLRCNVPRLQAGIELLEDAPIIYDLGTFTEPTLDSAQANEQLVEIGFTDTDDWATHAGGHLLAWCGRTTSPSHNFFGGPWRYAGKVDGPTPPPAALSFVAPWPISIGNQIWVKCRIIQADGRLSLPIIIGPHIVTFIVFAETPPPDEEPEDDQG